MTKNITVYNKKSICMIIQLVIVVIKTRYDNNRIDGHNVTNCYENTTGFTGHNKN